jgi:hypothetical protein
MKSLNPFRLGSLCLFVVGTLALGGCVVGLGNRSGANQSDPTLGQELIDLKKAREAEAISEEEYQQQKRKLLEYREKR